MKKTILTLFIAGFVFSAYSQAKLELGLKAGANFSNADAGSLDTDAITAFHGGIYTLAKLANIGIQPEILWSKQGADTDFGDLDLSYISLPLMVKFYLPLGLNLQAGPQLGILVDAEDDEGSVYDSFKTTDTSIALGAGWDAPFGLQFTARYVLGLSDNGDISDLEYKNRMFQLALGYRLFKLGK